MQDIISGRFRQVLVSPEVATSSSFNSAVLQKPGFHTKLRAVCIDEAHCISLWGGSFRPDYAGLGVLRGRFPRNVPIVIASATLPEHVLEDIRRKLKLSKSCKMVSLTNERPNVALSVREMKYSDESKGDLQFLIPPGALKVEDIPITLVYCNQRTSTEDCADRLRSWAEDCGIDPACISFYHAKVGTKRKREIEVKLAEGKIRIVACTDAVGMVSHYGRNKFAHALTVFRDVICATLPESSFGVYLRRSVPLYNELGVQEGTSKHLARQ